MVDVSAREWAGFGTSDPFVMQPGLRRVVAIGDRRSEGQLSASYALKPAVPGSTN